MKRKARILVVDDNATNIAIVEEILGEDYCLKTAMSGEECLEVVEEFAPDVVLLDIMMPGIDGYETCRALRKLPKLQHVKVILVSAKAMVSERLAGYEAGADDYLTKPFDEEELLAKVSVFLRLKSAEEVEQLKTNILALLNHEIRTPLNGLMGAIEMLQMDGEMSKDEQTTWTQMAADSGAKILEFFDRALLLSRLNSNSMSLDLQPLPLADLVEQAMESIRGRMSERSVEVATQFGHESDIWVDRQHFLLVLAGLLDNAVRFSPESERVVVESREVDGAVEFTVADQGPGIDVDMLPHIFNAFTDADISHHSEGHGLSLAIAREIVLAHGGEIDVESAAGSGTTIRIQVPVRVAEAVGAHPASDE